MLYGYMIFIKKTGGDGSKFPVTEKSIKIGRGEDCLIRIHNPLVSLEHCQLIIDDNGMAKLRNFSNVTTLNGKHVSQGDVMLCHGDIFKLGERLVRWEYLPSSKYYKNLPSPGGRLLAVVMPQQRAMFQNGQFSPGASTSGTPSAKSTPHVKKQRNSEAYRSESSKKAERMSSANKTPKGLNNLAKFLSSRHSLQGSIAVFSPKMKQRKSTSGIMSSKPSTQEKTRKSTMASWKIKLVTPPSDKKTKVKKTPVNKSISLIKQSENRSGRKSIIKTPTLKTVTETPSKQLLKQNEFSPQVLLTMSSKKLTPKPLSVQSEKKFNKRKGSTSPPGVKRLSLKPKTKTPKSDIKKIYDRLSTSFLEGNSSNQSTDMFDSYILLKNVSNDFIMQAGSQKKLATPVKTPAKKSPEKVQSSSKKMKTSGIKRASSRVSGLPDELSSPLRKSLKLEMTSSPSFLPSSAKKSKEWSLSAAAKSPPSKGTPRSKVKSGSKRVSVSVSAKKTPKAKKSLMRELKGLGIVESQMISSPAISSPKKTLISSVKKTPKSKKIQRKETPKSAKKPEESDWLPEELESPRAQKLKSERKKTPKGGKSPRKGTSVVKVLEDDLNRSSEGLKSPAARRSGGKSPVAEKSLGSAKKTPKGGINQKKATPRSVKRVEENLNQSAEGLKSTPSKTTPRSAVKFTVPKKSPVSLKKTPKGGKSPKKETLKARMSDDDLSSPKGLKSSPVEKTPRSGLKSPVAKKSPASLKKTPKGGRSPKKATPRSVRKLEEDLNQSSERLQSTPFQRTRRSGVERLEDDTRSFTTSLKSPPAQITPRSALKSSVSKKSPVSLKKTPKGGKSPKKETPRSGVKSPVAKKSPGSAKKTPMVGQNKGTPKSKERPQEDPNRFIEDLESTPGQKALRSKITSPVAVKSPASVRKTPKSRSLKKETPKSRVLENGSSKSPTARKTPTSGIISPVAVKSPASAKKTPEAGKSPKQTPGSEIVSVTSSVKKSPASAKKTPKAGKSPSKEKLDSARGVRRKLSPSLSSAERAAKKLKTSSPRKPDKNKKAALLVLGKANRKQLMPQNVKVLLKQKIVKKAIKQSTALPVRKDKKLSKAVKKVLKKGVTKPKKKSAIKGTPKNEKATVRALRLGEALLNENNSPVTTSKTQLSEITALEEKTSSVSRGSISSQSPSSIMTSPSKGSPSKEKAQKSTGSRVSFSPVKQTSAFSSPFGNSLSLAEYSFASNRRCSKRLSSKNENSRPDFMELSPTALGLIPKNVGMFRTPKEVKRRSSSLATPKNAQMTGIIKSASTSKIASRKFVRFSSKDESFSPTFDSFNSSKETDFDFESIRTPNITTDFFVSPLSVTTGSKSEASKSAKGKASPKVRKSAECVRKLLTSLQSPGSSATEVEQRTPKSVKVGESPQSGSKTGKGSLKKDTTSPKSPRSSKKDAMEGLGVAQLTRSPKEVLVEKSSPLPETPKESPKKKVGSGTKTLPKPKKSPKNDLSNVSGVKRLMKTPRVTKSPKNDLSNVSGVKKLLKTPKVQKSPKNDLSNVSGVKKLLKTPKIQKSPKNDLSDLRGVKELLGSPKNPKSPKNDLSDLKGVKRLLKTPKVQKSPKNDLTDLKGVKRLLGSPKTQKSPKNDLTNVDGVRKLMKTPRVQKSPKNDLTNVQGVKRLLKTPREAKSPKNDLTDVRGVKRLMKTPRVQKSPKNDLTNVKGLKRLMKTPRVQKSPKNDLSDLRGVSKLLKSPRVQKDPKNSLLDVSGVANLFETAEKSRTPQKITKEPAKSPSASESSVTGVKQLLVAESPVRSLHKKSELSKLMSSYRSIRGRRTIYSTPKGPKNDLTDVAGVRELFARNKPINDLDISLTGVAELFEIPVKTSAKKQEATKSTRKKPVRKSAEVAVGRAKSRRVNNDSSAKDTEVVSSRGRRRKVAAVVEEKAVKSKKSETESKVVTEKKPTKRRAVKEVSVVAAKKVLKSPVKKVTRGRQKKETVEVVDISEDVPEVVVESRKRKTAPAVIEPSPPKLRRRQAAEKRTPAKVVSKKSKKEEASEVVIETKVSRTRGKPKTVASKTPTKVESKTSVTPTKKSSAKSFPKVQKRSQADSKAKKSDEGLQISPRRTRNAKAKTVTQEKKSQVQKKVSGVKTVKSTVAKKKLSPVKRSTRRK